MVGGEVAGKTAVVLLGAHRFHSLAGFLSEGVGASGICWRSNQEIPLCFRENRTMLGKKIKASFFCHSKRDELISKDH